MPDPLIFNHDGATDELMSTALLTTPDFTSAYDLKGVVITNADSMGPSAVSATRKILRLGGLDHVPVALSAARGWNPFPWQYRQYSLMVDPLPILNPQGGKSVNSVPLDGEQLLTDLLEREADGSVTLLITCPFTTLTNVLSSRPGLVAKIRRIVWMGGALGGTTPDGKSWGVGGNVDSSLVPGANPWAEWNVFWDPWAVASIFATKVPLVMFPLNVTDAFPVDSDWILNSLDPLAAQRPLCNLAANSYCMVVPQGGYSLWDVVTTVSLTRPDFFGYDEMTLSVVVDGQDQGRLVPSKEGKSATVAKQYALPQAVLDYVVAQWAR